MIVSARRRRVSLYIHFHPHANINSVEVTVFLRALLRHLRGHVIVLWDSGNVYYLCTAQYLRSTYHG